MSTRREFAKTAIGALFGISAIPDALEKPKFPLMIMAVDPSYVTGESHPAYFHMVRGLWHSNGTVEVLPDITIAQKIALKDRFS